MASNFEQNIGQGNNQLKIHWFPGHMAKTRRLMAANLKMVDVVVELLDARIPFSSRNPEIDRICGTKPRLIVLNKCDSADENVTKQWIAFFAEKGIAAVPTDCRSGKGLNNVTAAIRTLLKEQRERFEKKGMAGRPIRMMIVGIPNVGKSSFINRMAGSKRAKVEDRPGVTRGKQWVKLESGMELLDMPGVLWPKFDDSRVAEHLAFTGAIKDDIMDVEGLAAKLAERIAELYPKLLCERFGLDSDFVTTAKGHEIINSMGRKRGMLVAGGEVDTLRASVMLLDEFRGAKLGRISLDRPKRKQNA